MICMLDMKIIDFSLNFSALKAFSSTCVHFYAHARMNNFSSSSSAFDWSMTTSKCSFFHRLWHCTYQHSRLHWFDALPYKKKWWLSDDYVAYIHVDITNFCLLSFNIFAVLSQLFFVHICLCGNMGHTWWVREVFYSCILIQYKMNWGLHSPLL